MRLDLKFFKKSKSLAIDNFFKNVLYDKKFGYYSSKNPLGEEGDFITSPKISQLFSEIISIWIISSWKVLGKPKLLNIVELGPGDGSYIKVLLEVSKNFPEFNSAIKIYLHEASSYLKEIQKKKIKNKKIKWIKDFNSLKKGPVIFFGNEFFDAMPIKQFRRKQNFIYEKYFTLTKGNYIKEEYKKAKKEDIKIINSYKIFKNQKFIELPKCGLKKLKMITKTLTRLKGCILLIDYGYSNPANQNTLQSVMKNKKNRLLDNLGKADITSHVNFSILKEFFLKNELKVKKVISQRDFLMNMGIIQRANLLSKKMKFREQTNLYLRLKRLLSQNLMGQLFKVILAYKNKRNNFFGFN